MSKRPFDPLRLDTAAFAEAAGEMAGQWPLTALPRLAEMAHHEGAASAAEPVEWRVRGEKRKTVSLPVQTWLHLDAHARIELLCQRCLQPVAVNVDALRSFLFVEGEAAAAELDAQSEDDVLALSRDLDLRDLVEDELLLSLPLIPKHEVCPQPLLAAPDAAALEPELAHPFAALAALKRGKNGGLSDR
jgi:uncharacterized protein